MKRKKDAIDWMYFILLIVICVALFATVAYEMWGKNILGG